MLACSVIQCAHYFTRKPSSVEHCKLFLVDPLVCVCFSDCRFCTQRQMKQWVHCQEDLTSWANDKNISLTETKKALMADHKNNTAKCSITEHNHFEQAATVFFSTCKLALSPASQLSWYDCHLISWKHNITGWYVLNFHQIICGAFFSVSFHSCMWNLIAKAQYWILKYSFCFNKYVQLCVKSTIEQMCWKGKLHRMQQGIEKREESKMQRSLWLHITFLMTLHWELPFIFHKSAARSGHQSFSVTQTPTLIR